MGKGTIRSSLRACAALGVVVLSACATGDPTGTASSTTVSPTIPTSTETTILAPVDATTTTLAFTPAGTELFVVGDWGSGLLPEGAVAGAMQRHAEMRDVEALLTTGDNLSSNDAKFLLRPYSWVEEGGIPWWITWGNHDVESEDRIEAVNQAFASPPRWAIHRWGDIDVVIVDSTQVTNPAQAVFLTTAMAQSNRPTIVAMHHPPYSCTHVEPTIDEVDQVVELLDHDVVLVLSGHDHSYQRFERGDVSFVVTGGGGSPLHELSDCPADHPELLVGAALHHFVVLTQTAESIELAAIDVNGDVIDETSVALP